MATSRFTYAAVSDRPPTPSVAEHIDALERVRRVELDGVRAWIPPGTRVLELGGGSGLQARQIAGWGCRVVSVDIDLSERRGRLVFPVRLYDGLHLPFPDASFDVVFSSNVLEHVERRIELLEEVARVLRPGGVAIHILPTPTWRFWTSLAHYPFLVTHVLGSHRGRRSSGVPSLSEGVAKRGLRYAVRRALAAGPHGEFPNALSELWYFSRRYWRGVFESSGMVSLSDFPSGVFYSGYGLFRRWTMKRRSSLARVLGSSCRTYVMRNQAAEAPMSVGAATHGHTEAIR